MRDHRDQIMKEFSEFRIEMEKQRLHGGRPSSSFLITYESGKLIAVETGRTFRGLSMRQDRWVWEITGEELTLTFNAYGRGEEVLHFKRV
jgi:hypothetical protein